MRTSTIRQSVVLRSGQAKNSSAEANTLAVNPTERMKPRKASRTDSSSSTIEMIGWCATLILIMRARPSVHYALVPFFYTLVYVDGESAKDGYFGWGIPNFS